MIKRYFHPVDTREEGEAFIQRELERYPKAGYDTKLAVIPVEAPSCRQPKAFVVVGSRLETC